MCGNYIIKKLRKLWPSYTFSSTTHLVIAITVILRNT